MSEYRLEMRGVVKTFPGVKALDHAQLKLRPGTVHALMGENGAGKSTLMKCMFGIYHMDEGEVIYEGEPVEIKGPLDALNRGIAMVHQELQPIPERSIGENIYVGRYPTKKVGPVTIIDHEKMYEDAAKVLKEVHLNFDPKAKLGSLSLAGRKYRGVPRRAHRQRLRHCSRVRGDPGRAARCHCRRQSLPGAAPHHRCGPGQMGSAAAGARRPASVRRENVPSLWPGTLLRFFRLLSSSAGGG